MGMSPAPEIANLFVAIYETEVIIPIFKKYLPVYLRLIDDDLCNSVGTSTQPIPR